MKIIVKTTIVSMIMFAVVFFGAGFIVNTVFGDDDSDEQAIESNDDHAPNTTNPLSTFRLQDNGTLSSQLDTLKLLLCQMNINHGVPELNNQPCVTIP